MHCFICDRDMHDQWTFDQKTRKVRHCHVCDEVIQSMLSKYGPDRRTIQEELLGEVPLGMLMLDDDDVEDLKYQY